MRTDSLNRAQTTAAVLLVAAIAAVVSFIHIQHLAVTHGQDHLAAVLIPLSIDGTVAAMSGLMLSAARRQMPAHPLARVMLALAVAATLGANVASGIASGIIGALIAGWPAVAFVGCVEVSIGMVRRMRATDDAAAAHQPQPDRASGLHPATVPGINGHAHLNGSADAPAITAADASGRASGGEAQPRPQRIRSRARKAQPDAPDPLKEFASELASGPVPSLRVIQSRMHVGQGKAKGIQRDLERELAHRTARVP